MKIYDSILQKNNYALSEQSLVISGHDRMEIVHACFLFATNSPKLQLHYNLMKTC